MGINANFSSFVGESDAYFFGGTLLLFLVFSTFYIFLLFSASYKLNVDVQIANFSAHASGRRREPPALELVF